MVTPFQGIYRGKRVLVTGHTGFKGGWLSLWLSELGAEVSGLALPPSAAPNFHSILPQDLFRHSFLTDLRDDSAIRRAIRTCRPHLVFHLAAQPLVGVSYREPIETFTTNALGTAQLLEAFRAEKIPASIVVVTSDKCYRNDDSGHPFREDAPLGGNDIYSMSKAATELVVSAWHASYFAGNEALGSLATARAGNVIGGGDYAEDRLVPDVVRAFGNRAPLILRRPDATRPWQHVLESLSGYLSLGRTLLAGEAGGDPPGFNFGPGFDSDRSVAELLETWREYWPETGDWLPATEPAYGEATCLRLDSSRAQQELGWRSTWDFRTSIRETAEWYRLRHREGAEDETMLAFTSGQIAAYTEEANQREISWAC